MTGRTTFDYAGSMVAVDTSDAADLTWLREFVCPDFDETTEAPARRVTLCRDDEEYEALLRLGARTPPRSAPCFVLDGRIEALPFWNTRNEHTIVHSPEFETFFARSAPDGPFRLVARRGGGGPRVALLRVLRELASAHLAAHDRLVVHGAAFAWRGRGCLLAGAKEAGKTTFLLYMLSEAGASLLASDRTAIWRSRDDIVAARGMPTIVNVRATTLERLPKVEARVAHSAAHHRWTLAETEGRGVTADDAWESSRSLTPAQLTRLLGVERSPQVPLGAVLFPRRSGESGGVSMTRLTPEDARQRLHAVLFRAGDHAAGEYFAAGSPTVPGERALGVCRDLARAVPCYDCVIGLDAWNGTDAVAQTLAVL